MGIHFTQFVIGVRVDTVSSTEVQTVMYLQFTEPRDCVPYPAQVLNPLDAKFLSSEDEVKNWIKLFEMTHKQYKNKLFVIPVECRIDIPDTYRDLEKTMSSQKKIITRKQHKQTL